jgi:2-polyprenyl-6-methoxyphenol hydroxylase-like FAD-dependent oxidoreductase
MTNKDTNILIVGGGPAGLALAIELGQRGVSSIVFERSTEPPAFPKANSTTSRTMEHYRRLGISGEVRKLGLPDDYPPDISYHTHFGDYELARLRWPSRQEALAARGNADGRWPTPEPMHRAQQMYIEPVLRRHVQQLQQAELRVGWQVEAVEEKADGVAVRVVDIATGNKAEVKGDYLVGCDGPRSLVREALGIKFEGTGAEDREFMGGRMLATYFRASNFYSFTPERPSWQYWAISKKRFGALVAIDGKELFVLHTQLPRGTDKSAAFAREAIEITAGRPFQYEIIGIAEWTAGFTLVAERYASKRVFLAGDAAHLFTPTAGLGYNTSVDDAANLGWKLAAACLGWGGPRLLDTYEIERKPIAERNTRFARSIAEYFRSIELPEALEQDGAAGDSARAEYGRHLHALGAKEFDAPGIVLGMYYGASPIVALESGDPPADDPNFYVPSAKPGARAPHAWLSNGDALFDRFGRDFTLLKLRRDVDTAALERAATSRGIPLKVIAVDDAPVHDLYGRDLTLIRPDQHIAWRGNAPPERPETLLEKVVGY